MKWFGWLRAIAVFLGIVSEYTKGTGDDKVAKGMHRVADAGEAIDESTKGETSPND